MASEMAGRGPRVLVQDVCMGRVFHIQGTARVPWGPVRSQAAS